MTTRARSVLAAATAALAALAAVVGVGAPTAAAATPKVLVVGMDGLRWDRVAAADAPTLDALAAGGTLGESLLYCSPMAGTWSGAGWSTIATGVWPDKHGVKDNSFAGKRYDQYPDFLTRLEKRDPRYSTLSIVDWAALHRQGTFSDAVDTRITYDGDRDGYAELDEKVTADAERLLRTGNPDASFVYLGHTDEVAHSKGAASAEYLSAIAKQDQQLARILAAVRSRSTYSAENWLVVVTTDHGHTDRGGHGGCGVAERSTFLLGSGAGLAAGARPIDTRLVDVASTVFRHLGVPADAGWKLDGKPLGERSADPFDTLAGQLKPRVDETEIPASVRGWTHTAPSGWSVDRSGMPGGGVTEWRGWSFTNDQFWSRTQSGQWRENNVRARGVFAVADSDEFADRSGGGSFDSTLVSAPYAVSGKSALTLRFVNHYRQEGAQKADVLVSFDGGPDQLVKRYDTDVVSSVEALPVAVPAGAGTVKVKFRYHDASNNWYWAIDDLRVD
ncbi:alkaline phosphatase family protein [Streptoalloteichus hindustanus]|uniref:Type I phosphodiesterase / nucleotide pyrophosphatase n=1 Tax=Streptoalloteichus hindustanus TaxID=2017 RepID=A0A1M5EMK2_STRHI|nr:alkaline phosphatase family protein [Streptoalloteichus hindustanus]SHF80469.1 Type I phosphodiesterase / nucleotide pyrophosphatase [Streptoalloteichus hindustanus]